MSLQYVYIYIPSFRHPPPLAHEKIGLEIKLLLSPQVGILVSFLDEINRYLRSHIHILYCRKFNKKIFHFIIRSRKYLPANLLQFTFHILFHKSNHELSFVEVKLITRYIYNF